MGPGFWGLTVVLGVIALANAAYFLFGNVDWLLPGSANPVADRTADVDGLFKFMAVFGGAIMIYVAGYVLYFAWAFRARPGDDETMVGVPIHDAPKLELWWTIVPSVLLIVLTAVSINVWYKIYFGSSAPALTTEVIGHQFYFEYRYPGLKGSVYSKTSPMHLPLGEPVRLLVTSTDVLHQVWVPEIRLKTAAVPGLVQSINFTPLRAGEYDIVCSEFCGVDHSLMQGKLIIEPVADFKKWMATENVALAKASSTVDLSTGTAAAGKALFDQKCSACHAIASFDQKKVGPGLLHITDDPAHPKLVDGKSPTPADIAEILEKGYVGPIGAMPNAQGNGISNSDIANLVAYLTSLK